MTNQGVSPMTISQEILRLKPTDRVRRYLDLQLEQLPPTKRYRIPTVRELATLLEVSPSTVQYVYERFKKEGKLTARVGDGTFVDVGREERGLRIGLNVARSHCDQREGWTRRIYGGITSAILESSRNITLTPVFQQMETSDKALDLLMDHAKELDGIIFLPAEFNFRAQELYDQIGIPVVYLNPLSETSTANFVSPDYLMIGRKVGEAFRLAGRKRILFIIGTTLAISTSTRLMFLGLNTGLELGTEEGIELRTIVTRDSSAPSAAQRFEKLLGSGCVPDAVFAGGDNLALGCAAACHRQHLSIPQQVSIVGSTGLDLSASAFPQLTRVQQPFDDLGRTLVEMVVQRIESDDADVIGQYLPASFVGGATTGTRENEHLRI